MAVAKKAAKAKKKSPKLPTGKELWVTYGTDEVCFPARSEAEALNLAMFFRSQHYPRVRFITGKTVTLNEYLQGKALDV